MLENEYGIFIDNGITGETAEQVFERWLANKDKTPEPTLAEKNRADIDYIMIMQGL